MAQKPLTVEALRSLVHYDEATGTFTRKVVADFNPRSRVGVPLGTTDRNGYLNFRVQTKRYLAHRLAWFYVYGVWPRADIDHVNGVKSDNRICNLREASRSQNMANTDTQANNVSGHRGVIFDKANKKWMAYMHQHGKFINLGRYAEIEQAVAVRQQAFGKAFREFVRPGSPTYP